MVCAWNAPRARHRFNCEYIRGPGRENGTLMILGNVLSSHNIARMSKIFCRMQQMR